MTVQLRPYQQDVFDDVKIAWSGGRPIVVVVLPTGGGKTRIIAALVGDNGGASCLIAHRAEIVGQLSCALAENGVPHRLIASKEDIRNISALHVKLFGRSFVDPNNRVAVASVDTLIRRKDLAAWGASVTLWVVDEGHHLVRENKWHRATQIFTNPDCRGVLPTASPHRPDGLGLGDPTVGGDGLALDLIEGPTLQWLIDEGYLCDYRILGADSHVAEFLGEVGKSGDWSAAQRKQASEQSTIVGDAVGVWLNVNAGLVEGIPAMPGGRSSILFASDISDANKFLTEFRRKEVRAELVTGDTDATIRRQIFQRLEDRLVDVVIAVDVVSEGTDIPALEIGSLCRPTASEIIYLQQLGRVLRPLPTPQFKSARTREERLAAIAASRKPFAILIDHVGNFLRHGPPQKPRQWSLISTNRKSGPSDTIASRYCLSPACSKPFERFRDCCPYCGWVPDPPADRSSPPAVKGDMSLIDPALVLAMCRDAAEAVLDINDYRAKLAATGLPQQFIWANAKKHAEKTSAQTALRATMEVWGGRWHASGLSDREIQKLFFERFGVDVITCQSWGPADALALMEKVVFDDTRV